MTSDRPAAEPDDDSEGPRQGEVWYAEIHGKHDDKLRPVVVVGVYDELLEVVYGGGNPHPAKEHHAVEAATRHGKLMGLTKDTYFRLSSVRSVERTRFDVRIGRCPLAVFRRLDKIAHDYHLRYPEPLDDVHHQDEDGA